MAKHFQKVYPLITLEEFLNKAKKVSSFASLRGRKYKVIRFENYGMFFIRLDSDNTIEWNMDLKKVYKAYEKLTDFKTENFKPFVPIRHSPARGLLLHLNLLK